MNHIIITPISTPIEATISIPGSKSYTNRALVIAALSDKKVIIKNPLLSDDTEAMADCLEQLNYVLKKDANSITVEPRNISGKNLQINLNARLSGTTIRFVLALACVLPGVKKLTGLEGLNKRPIKDLVDGLKQLGADIEYLGRDGFPPLRISSSTLHPGTTKLNGDVSSQYFSAIMMIAPTVGKTFIEVIGNQISKSYIDMTIDTMRQFGVEVKNNNYKNYSIDAEQKFNLDEYVVEGDFSAAGYFFAIGALTRSKITLNNLNPTSKQGDRQFASILEMMGNKIVSGNNSMTIIGNGVQPVTVNMEQCPDQAQTLSVLAAFAKGKTVMHGIRSLRVKETERATAIQKELDKMGIRTESTYDTLIIHGGNPKPATIDTYGDHRMAMSFAIAGTALSGMVINNPEVVNKTFPNFWKVLESIGVNLKHG